VPHIYKNLSFLYFAGSKSGDPRFSQYTEYADDHPESRRTMCEQQLRIITYAAMIGIILDQKMMDTKAKLESMHLPVEIFDGGTRHFQRINIKQEPYYALTFSRLVESYDNDEHNSLSNRG